MQDAQGNFTQVTNSATGQLDPMRAAVYLQTSDLQDSQGSTGPEVFDYRHPDPAANADKAWLNTLDAQGNSNVAQTFSNHATMVAGVMVAARNGEDGVGVAYNASNEWGWTVAA